MTPPPNSAARRTAPFADAAAREARHRVLEDLLAPYADGELPPETTAQVEAHLVGCGRCRGALDVQMAVGARLAAEPTPPAAALRAQIAAAVLALPAPVIAPAAAAVGPSLSASSVAAPEASMPPASASTVSAPADPENRTGARLLAWLMWSGWGVALLLGALLLRAVSRPASPAAGAPTVSGSATNVRAGIPSVDAALTDYRRVRAAALPGTAPDLAAVRAALPFPVEPIASAELRLLAAWTTQLDGEPAAALAYRWGDRLLLQYVIPERLFFRDPGPRAAALAGRPLALQVGAQGVLAWPEPQAGSILIGDTTSEALAAARAGSPPR